MALISHPNVTNAVTYLRQKQTHTDIEYVPAILHRHKTSVEQN